MKYWTKGVWVGLKEEMVMKSSYGKELGSDTLRRWLFSVLLFVGFYLCVHYYPYQQPVASKIAWHRLVASGMTGAGILFSTLDFLTSMYRRIRARIAAAKAKSEQLGSDNAPSDSKPS